MLRAGCLEPKLSLKYDSKNLEACSLTHRFAFSLECAMVAGLVTDFWRRATACALAAALPNAKSLADLVMLLLE